MRDVQCSHDGNFLEAMNIAPAFDLPHVLIEVACRLQQSFLFRRRTADLILFVENFDHYGAGNIFFCVHAISLGQGEACDSCAGRQEQPSG